MMSFFHKKLAWFSLVVCLLAVSSCLKEEPHAYTPDGGLLLQPDLVSLGTKTTTPGDDDRGENNKGTYLDVFFTGVGHSFWKEYHLSGRTFTNPKGELLSTNWKADGFDASKNYNVYVVLNGPSAVHSTVGSFSALQAIADTDTNIYQLQRKTGDRAVEAPHAYTAGSKSFLMDGYLANWSPDGSKTVQTIVMNTVKRAAAKIVLNVSYDTDFLDEIIAEEKTPAEPRFKLFNYASCSAAIAAGSVADAGLLNTSGWMRLNGYTSGVYDYSLTTYSYACTWGSGNAAVGLEAPYFLLSIPMGDDPEKVINHYYRIPVRPENVYSLDRNYIYTVNVEINSLGSYKEADAGIPVNLSYNVLSWTEDSSEVTNVETEVVHYFDALPTEIALRGEGTQTATIRYYAPTDATITIEDIPSAALSSAGAVAPSSGLRVLYFDKDGNPQSSSATISLNTTTQTITVNSDALANRASKYIRFRVWYDKNTAWEEYRDIYIRHFPTDNLQNIAGSWSSRWDEDYNKEYTFNPTAAGWASWEGIEESFTLCSSQEEYNNASDSEKYFEYGAWKNDAFSYYVDEITTQSVFQTAIPGSNNTAYSNRENANSFNNSRLGADGLYYYYGTDPQQIGTTIGGSSYSNADYWDSLLDWGIYKHWMKYSTYHKVTYYRAYARRYWRYTTTPPTPSTGDWLDYQYRTGTVATDGHFTAKVFHDNQIYNLNSSFGETSASGLTNNHMYVIQLSSISETYVLGRPVLDGNYQSQDNVVSPAFMMASQLGASSLQDSALGAAEHCGTYMEVGTDNTRYVGWRLPTKEEISIINAYQLSSATSETLASVLTGQYYWTLDGGEAKNIDGATSDSSTSSNAFTRCVRDLTPEELVVMNQIK